MKHLTLSISALLLLICAGAASAAPATKSAEATPAAKSAEATPAAKNADAAPASKVAEAIPAVDVVGSRTDSINRAYATVMAEYLLPYIKQNFPDSVDANKQFVEGMRHAFAIRHEDSPFYAGVRSAMANFDRFDSMVEMGFPFTPESYLDAMDAALRGETFGMNRESADSYLHQKIAEMYPAPQAPSAESQQAFLDAQKQREGVEALPSGLLFEVITEGEGEHPKANDVVRVTYTGALADGTVFDTTETPIDFPVNGVVKGFSEGLQMMKPGGTYRLYIPADLGYGDRGAGGVIPPGAALDFTVTLLDIVK